jgi:spore maturation protein CgeB
VRIFYAVPRSAWVDLNLRQSLEDMGHELVRLDFPGWPDDADPEWTRHGKPKTNERLIEKFQQSQVDLFFGYFYSSVVYPETIDLIRKSGVPTVNFSCNNVHQFDLVRDIAPRFDVCIVPERSAIQSFNEVGARPLRIQLAANPKVYKPYPAPRIYDVAFVGQRYADRAEFLDHLYRNGVGVHAWGAGWQRHRRVDLSTFKAAFALLEDEKLDGVRRMLRRRNGTHANGEADAVDTSAYGHPRLLHADLVRTFSKARISLGFATAGDSHTHAKRLTHLRLREFEAPMSGALYLTERQDELAEYFEIGKEVLAYTSRDDLLDQVRYYLAHPEQAEQIRHAGLERARRDHTWQRRFADLFSALGLKP